MLLDDIDIDGDLLTVNPIPVTGVSNGTLVLGTDGTFTYTPNADFNGTDSFVYEISDGNGGTAQATVEIVVGPVNDAPVASDDSFTTTEETPVSATLGVDDLLLDDTDIDGDSLTVNPIPVTGVSNGTLVLGTDGTFTYTPNADFNGTDSFVYEISDGNGGLAQAQASISVLSDNDAPMVVSIALDVPEVGTLTTITSAILQATDPDDNASNLEYTVQSLPNVVPGLTIDGVMLNVGDSFTQEDIDNDLLAYSHDSSDQSGPLSVVLDLTDSSGSSQPVTLLLNVINDAPFLDTNAPLVVEADSSSALTTASLLFEDADDDSSDRVYTVLSGPSSGTLARASDPTVAIVSFTQEDIDNGLVYTHDGSLTTTTDSFEFEVSDGQATTNPETFSIVLVGEAPVASGGTISTAAGQAIQVNDPVLLDSATSSTAPEFAPGGTPENGTVQLGADGSFSYIPNPGFVGTDSFTYVIENQFGSGTATILIDVSAPVAPPISSDSSDTDSPPSTNEETVVSTKPPLPPDRVEFTRETPDPPALSEARTAIVTVPNAPLPTDDDATVRVVDSQDSTQRASRFSIIVNPLVEDFVTGTFDVAVDFVNLRFDQGALLENLDDFHETMMTSVSLGEWSVPQGIAITGGLSIGWVLWSLKGGYIVGSLISAATPTWSLIDPLPVFDTLGTSERRTDDEKDALEEMLVSGAAKA